jgi:hypothetical protein
MGLGIYGRSFTLTNPANNGIGAAASGGGAAGNFKTIAFTLKLKADFKTSITSTFNFQAR